MHNESNGDTIPLAAHRKALREAYVAGYWTSVGDDSTVTQRMFRPAAFDEKVQAEALRRWPEPEPELRWVKCGPYEYARLSKKDWRYRIPGIQSNGNSTGFDDEGLRQILSLLPREPVAVTDETVRKAYDTWYNAPAGSEAFRLVAEAVAADLAGPVGVAEKPKAQWWGVQLKGESQPFMVGSEQEARKVASGYPGSRVVGLAEVEG